MYLFAVNIKLNVDLIYLRSAWRDMQRPEIENRLAVGALPHVGNCRAAISPDGLN
jgi:hypothetical protein